MNKRTAVQDSNQISAALSLRLAGLKRVDPATMRCEQHQLNMKTNSRKPKVDTQCQAQAAGNWEIGTGKYPKFKWLCLGHSIWWGVSRNPQQAVFEEEQA